MLTTNHRIEVLQYAMEYTDEVLSASVEPEPPRYVRYFGRSLNVGVVHLSIMMKDGTQLQAVCGQDRESLLITITEMIEQGLSGPDDEPAL